MGFRLQAESLQPLIIPPEGGTPCISPSDRRLTELAHKRGGRLHSSFTFNRKRSAAIMTEATELIMVAPVEEIRAPFPALERRHNGHPAAYFDAPGGTQVPRVVVEAMNDYLYHHNA